MYTTFALSGSWPTKAHTRLRPAHETTKKPSLIINIMFSTPLVSSSPPPSALGAALPTVGGSPLLYKTKIIYQYSEEGGLRFHQ